MTTTRRLPVEIYVRLSEVRPGEEAVSLDTQEADARVLVKRKGWHVSEVYCDAGRSAWSDTRDRPAFDRMVADLDAHKILGVVAWKQDRLGRRVAEVAALSPFESLVAAGGVVTPQQEFRRRPKPNFLAEELAAGRKQAADERAEREALDRAEQVLNGRDK
jgi:hypothetical protein